MSVKKRYRIFTILSVLVVSAGGILTWRVSATTVIPAGYDQFTTQGSGATYEPWNTIPAGFFKKSDGTNSVATFYSPTFAGRNAVPGFVGDTVIERTNSVTVPGSSALVLTGIRFVAETPLTVTFADGSNLTYTVLVDESDKYPSTGQITFNNDVNHTYNSSIGMNRVYTFIPTTEGQPTKTAESAETSDVFPALNLQGTGNWSVSGGPSAAANIQPQSGMSTAGAVATTSPTPCIVNPTSEQASLAAHGMGPAVCPTPSPTPTRTATPIIVGGPTP